MPRPGRTFDARRLARVLGGPRAVGLRLGWQDGREVLEVLLPGEEAPPPELRTPCYCRSCRHTWQEPGRAFPALNCPVCGAQAVDSDTPERTTPCA